MSACLVVVERLRVRAPARTIPMDDKRFRSDRGRDPIAELARLIAKADTHDESVPSDNRSREETVSDEAPELPPAPQLTVGLYEHEQGCERDEHCYGVQAHDIGCCSLFNDCVQNLRDCAVVRRLGAPVAAAVGARNSLPVSGYVWSLRTSACSRSICSPAKVHQKIRLLAFEVRPTFIARWPKAGRLDQGCPSPNCSAIRLPRPGAPRRP
jgi:hypothetical protein